MSTQESSDGLGTPNQTNSLESLIQEHVDRTPNGEIIDPDQIANSLKNLGHTVTSDEVIRILEKDKNLEAKDVIVAKPPEAENATISKGYPESAMTVAMNKATGGKNPEDVIDLKKYTPPKPKVKLVDGVFIDVSTGKPVKTNLKKNGFKSAPTTEPRQTTAPAPEKKSVGSKFKAIKDLAKQVYGPGGAPYLNEGVRRLEVEYSKNISGKKPANNKKVQEIDLALTTEIVKLQKKLEEQSLKAVAKKEKPAKSKKEHAVKSEKNTKNPEKAEKLIQTPDETVVLSDKTKQDFYPADETIEFDPNQTVGIKTNRLITEEEEIGEVELGEETEKLLSKISDTEKQKYFREKLKELQKRERVALRHRNSVTKEREAENLRRLVAENEIKELEEERLKIISEVSGVKENNPNQELSAKIKSKSESLRENRAKRLGAALTKTSRATLEKSIDGLLWTGNHWNKLPLKTKLLISIGLTGATIVTGGATIYASGAIRAVSATGLGITIFKALDSSYAAKNKAPASKKRRVAYVAGSALFAFLIGSGLAQSAIAQIFEKIGDFTSPDMAEILKETKTNTIKAPETIPEAEDSIPKIAEQVPAEIEKTTPEVVLDKTPQNMGADVPKENLSSNTYTSDGRDFEGLETGGEIYTIKAGDSLTKIIQEKILSGSGLSGHQLENATANLINELKQSPEFYKVFPSGDPNLIRTGDFVDIDKIKEVLDISKINGQNIIDHAKTFSPEITQPQIPTPQPEQVIDRNVTPINPQGISTEIVNTNEEDVLETEDYTGRLDQENTEETPSTNNTPSQPAQTELAQNFNNLSNPNINSETANYLDFKIEQTTKKVIADMGTGFKIFGFNIGGPTGEEIMESFSSDKASEFLADNNPKATEPGFSKLKEVLTGYTEGTGLKPEENESVEKYLKRMIAKSQEYLIAKNKPSINA